MTTIRTRTSTSRRSVRAAAIALAAGAGIALTPVPASADAGGSAAPVRSTPVATAPAASAPAVAPAASAPAVAPVAARTAAAQVAVNTALAQVGKPYRWGATGPNAYDCSGLTSSAYRAAGITIPRTSRAQAAAGVPVSRADLQPGDLIFFYSPVGHVGMYIGNGKMVHSSTYGQPVAVVDVDSMWGYNSARRYA